MLNRIRDAAFAVAALGLAAGVTPSAEASPTFSTAPVWSASGNYAFAITDATCKTGDCDVEIEVVPFQQNAFLIRNKATGSPLVAAGEDLAIFYVAGTANFVNGLPGGPSFDRWMAQLIDAPNGSFGENVKDFDGNVGLGLGFGGAAGEAMQTIVFGEQDGFSPFFTRGIFGDKDLFGAEGPIGAMVQGLISPVPAPAAFALFALGLAGLAVTRRHSA